MDKKENLTFWSLIKFLKIDRFQHQKPCKKIFFTVLNFNPSLIDKTFHIVSPPTPALNLTPFSSGSGSGREGRGKRSQAIPPKAAYKGLN